jgi:hypothetical protein
MSCPGTATTVTLWTVGTRAPGQARRAEMVWAGMVRRPASAGSGWAALAQTLPSAGCRTPARLQDTSLDTSPLRYGPDGLPPVPAGFPRVVPFPRVAPFRWVAQPPRVAQAP